MKRLSTPHRPITAAAILLLMVVAATLRPVGHAVALSATGPLLSNGNGTGTGSVFTTDRVRNPYVQIFLQGARPSATYAVFACIRLLTGGFDCVGRNNPPGLPQIAVAPRALAPIVVTLAQQGTLAVDDSGAGSQIVPLTGLLLPDTVGSRYNVVQLINTADPTDSYTALNLPTPVQPVAGTNGIVPVEVDTIIGVPVYVFAQLPGYAFPIGVTALFNAPFLPFFALPFDIFGTGFNSFTNGVCPNTGQPPRAVPANGGIAFVC